MVKILILLFVVSAAVAQERVNPYSLRNDAESFLTLKKVVEPVVEIEPIEEPTEEPKIIPAPKPKIEVTTPKPKVITKVVTVKEYLPKPQPTEPKIIIKEKIKFLPHKGGMINTIGWGVFSLLSVVLLGLYLHHRRRQQELSLVDVTAYRQHTFQDQLRQLRIGYTGLEKVVGEFESRLTVLDELAGKSLSEHTKKLIEGASAPLIKELNDLKSQYKTLDDSLKSIREHLKVLDGLEGQPLLGVIQKIAHDVASTLDKPFSESFTRFKEAQEKIVTQVYEGVDKKIEGVLAAKRELERGIEELKDKIDALEVESLREGLPKRPPRAEVKVTPQEQEKLHALIYKLADEGKGVDEIAQAVNLGTAEVRLILGLRKPERSEEET